MPQHEVRARSSVAVTAGALALLLGGITAAVGDAVAGSSPASLPGADAVHGAESKDGRLRTRMVVAHLTSGTHLIFEVHLRDRTWMVPDARLLRVVVRAMPEYGVHEPFDVGTGVSLHDHADRTPVGNPKPPASSASASGSPASSAPASARPGSDTFRSAIVAAATLPAGATGFTFFRAALDVSGLDRGDYLASVELVARGDSWGARAGGGNVIDAVTHAYEAW